MQRITQIDEFINESIEHGAKIISGGETIGNCYTPTILEADCDNDTANCKEVFGPVVTVSKVKNLEQASQEEIAKVAGNSKAKKLVAYFKQSQ